MTMLKRINKLLDEEERGLDWEDRAVDVINEYYDEMSNPDDMIYHIDDDIIEDYLAKKIKDCGIFILKSILAGVQNGNLYVKFDVYGRLQTVDTDNLVELLEWAMEDYSK